MDEKTIQIRERSILSTFFGLRSFLSNSGSWNIKELAAYLTVNAPSKSCRPLPLKACLHFSKRDEAGGVRSRHSNDAANWVGLR